MTSLRLLACALLVVAACSKAAESQEVESARSESSKPTGAVEATPTSAPNRELADTVERPKVAEGGDQQVPADSAGADPSAQKDPGAAANLKETVKPHKGHAAVDKAKTKIVGTKTQIVAMESKTLADTPEYKLVVVVPDSTKPGKEGAVKVLLTPKKGWKLNKDFPTKLKVSPPAGVKVKKAKQNVGDAVRFSEKGGAEWHVKFTSDSTGKKQFGGEFRFAVCTESTCDPKKEKLAFAVNVK